MPDQTTLAFDVYGTLFDPLGVATTLQGLIGERAIPFAQAGREKQLEYRFRRALMRDYRDFPTCTRQSLEFVDTRFGTALPAEAIETLMHMYLELPAYPEASYNPDPAVYRHFLARTGATAECCWLVSGNAFDILGAHSAGWITAWVRRDPTAVFDPWGIEPTLTVADLGELAETIPRQPTNG